MITERGFLQALAANCNREFAIERAMQSGEISASSLRAVRLADGPIFSRSH